MVKETKETSNQFTFGWILVICLTLLLTAALGRSIATNDSDELSAPTVNVESDYNGRLSPSVKVVN